MTNCSFYIINPADELQWISLDETNLRRSRVLISRVVGTFDSSVDHCVSLLDNAVLRSIRVRVLSCACLRVFAFYLPLQAVIKATAKKHSIEDCRSVRLEGGGLFSTSSLGWPSITGGLQLQVAFSYRFYGILNFELCFAASPEKSKLWRNA